MIPTSRSRMAHTFSLLILASCADAQNDCSNTCATQNATRCNNESIETCSEGGDGCWVWQTTMDCDTTGRVCKENNGQASCETPCTSTCPQPNQTRCLANVVQTCTAQENGCNAWTDGENCTVLSQYCSESTGAATCTPLGESFPIRVPQSHVFDCPDSMPKTFTDVDHVCTFKVGHWDTQIYVQATPTGCGWNLESEPTYEGGVSGWVKTPTQVQSIPAEYDGGGHHHDDWILIELEGRNYLLSHSSSGYMGPCAPPDCVIVCAEGVVCDSWGIGVETSGCEHNSPSLPVTCVVVNADGSVPDLLDPWVAHEGHPEYPLLPCDI